MVAGSAEVVPSAVPSVAVDTPCAPNASLASVLVYYFAALILVVLLLAALVLAAPFVALPAARVPLVDAVVKPVAASLLSSYVIFLTESVIFLPSYTSAE